ncbi:RelA/SpoT domain-containing protein, partial [Rhodobacter sp. HX-7-19]
MGSLDFDAEKSSFREFYNENFESLQAALSSFRTLIESLVQAKSDVAVSSVEGRIKDREECISKFTRKYRTALEASKTPYTIRDKITDLIGIRIVCLYEDEVERIKAAILEEFEVIEITDKISQVEGTEADIPQVACRLTSRSPDFARWASVLRPERCLSSRKRPKSGGSSLEPAAFW